jgi:hypothetical protein
VKNITEIELVACLMQCRKAAGVLELEQLAAKCVDKTGKHHPDLLCVVTAMLICCRAKKSRTA